MRETDGLTGVILLAYGGPRNEAEIEPFLNQVTGGRPLSPETVQTFKERYGRIGGRSPLPAIVDDLAESLANSLHSQRGRFSVVVGNLFSSPTIADAVAELERQGVARAVAITLVPQYSTATVGRYERHLDGVLEAAGRPFPVHFVRRWSAHPSLIDGFARHVEEVLASQPPEERTSTALIFTAHSVPVNTVPREDPFEAELSTTADYIARRVHMRTWQLAYQSGGRGGGVWFGPSVAEALAAAAAAGARSVLFVPIHFLGDNVEILYDLDVEARAETEQLGLKYLRAPSLNTSPLLVEALVDLVLDPPLD